MFNLNQHLLQYLYCFIKRSSRKQFRNVRLYYCLLLEADGLIS